MSFDYLLGPDDDSGPPRMTAAVLPTGGIIVIKFFACGNGPWTFTRSDGTNTVTLISAGDPVQFWLDCGDGLKTPLVSTSSYTYTLTTTTATIHIGPITPYSGITVETDFFINIVGKSLTAAFKDMTLPDGFKPPNVVHAMPLRALPTMPIISYAQETMQQQSVPLGQNALGYTNQVTEPVYQLVDRRYRITVLAMTVEERKFYRDAVVGIFVTMLGPLLGAIGQDVLHSFQTADSQVSGEPNSPGFYYSDIAWQFRGTFSTKVTAQPQGLINSISVNSSFSSIQDTISV